MHYDYKKKLNKVDSQQYRNLKIPEIDWVLNEAATIYVKSIAQPRFNPNLGFENNQRTIDDIRTLVINSLPVTITNNIASLPTDYMFYIKGKVDMTKEGCDTVKGNVHIRQHDDNFEVSPYDKSSFEWRTVNAVFTNQGIKFYTDSSFGVSLFYLSYIKQMAYMHNAEDFLAGGYQLPSGVALSGFQNCELPNHTHGEIVDLAVLITTGEIESQGYQLKQQKVNLNQ
jgi:hypothetical protein